MLDIIKHTYYVLYTEVFRICCSVYVKRSEVTAGSTVQHWGRCPLAGSASPVPEHPKTRFGTNRAAVNLIEIFKETDFPNANRSSTSSRTLD